MIREARLQSENTEPGSIENRQRDLRSRISEAGQQIDSYKAKTAALLGGGVFLLLLALGAAYDLAAGKAGVWLAFGITKNAFYWIAGGLAVGSLVLLGLGCRREHRRDRRREAGLAELEQELADLLESINSKS
jgi:hypothetical protein